MTLALVDCNNFFVSCERAFAPGLDGRPVLVLSNNDGCVISRSEEAKALGIPMGAPFFQVRAQAVQHRMAVISANHELYVDMSRRVSAVLAAQAREVEAYSIDESFLLVPDGDALEWGRAARAEVLRWTGLPVSVGLAPTKVLAKLASDQAKRSAGVLSLADPAAREPLLRQLPAQAIWGVAGASARKLAAHGIRTAWDLASAREGAVLQALGAAGAKIAAELRGQPCLPMNAAAPPRRSVTVSRSFANALDDFDPLWSAVASFTEQAGERLRRHGLAAGALWVYAGWRQAERLYTDGAARKLPDVADTPALLSAARQALTQAFRPARRYKKAGVVLGALSPADSPQVALFADIEAERRRRLMRTLDRLNAGLGPGTLRYGAASLSHDWGWRSENRSPCWTTRWEQLPALRASP
ncbi:MAG: Y-family DNA polymerase [Elusimicrobia bacterium]|nr:Y-family DNA polymerase [Elusimicrobiota bacterium]MDE2425214.1 Y-family DNA polymerase [Elusimicrobiota bacterium]